MYKKYSEIKNTLKEVQQVHHWYVQFYNPSVEGVNLSNISFLAQSTSLPVAEVTHTQVQLGGHTFNYPGKVNKSGTITITMVENTDADVMNELIAFYDKYYSGFNASDTDGKQEYGYGKLWFNVDLNLLDGGDAVKQTWTLVDCLLSFENGADLGQDAGPMQPAITITYNDFHWRKG